MTGWEWIKEKLQEVTVKDKATPEALKILDEALSEFAGYSCIDCECFIEDEFGCTKKKSCLEAQCEYLNKEVK